MTGRLLAIAIKPQRRVPMQLVAAADVTVAAGLTGDVRGKLSTRQITLLFEDDWRAACAALGEQAPWTLRRANLLLTGLPNPKRAGHQLRIGDVLLEITGETDPCIVMDRQLQGLRAALEPDWRGGLTSRVLEPGAIAVGAPVAFVA